MVAGLGLREGAPRVVGVMVASADGRAAVDGRSSPLGHPADRALFRELRTEADALLVGTGTLRAERYRAVLDDDQQAHRRAQGRPPKPEVATITRTLDVPGDIGLFEEPDQPIAVFTEAAGEAPSRGAPVRTVRLEPCTPAAVVAHLRAEQPLVLCEGGPTLLRALAAEGLLDDLVLTIAPLLVGGREPTTLAGAPLRPPARLALRGAWRGEAGDHLFLHYGRQG